jgi:hypothetical protein
MYAWTKYIRRRCRLSGRVVLLEERNGLLCRKACPVQRAVRRRQKVVLDRDVSLVDLLTSDERVAVVVLVGEESA